MGLAALQAHATSDAFTTAGPTQAASDSPVTHTAQSAVQMPVTGLALPFHGYQSSATTCRVCGTTSLVSLSPFVSLSLDLPSRLDPSTELYHVLPGTSVQVCVWDTDTHTHTRTHTHAHTIGSITHARKHVRLESQSHTMHWRCTVSVSLHQRRTDVH